MNINYEWQLLPMMKNPQVDASCASHEAAKKICEAFLKEREGE